MYARIFSWLDGRVITFAVVATVMLLKCPVGGAQTGAGYFTDPSTGIVYQQVTKTVERPVVETRVEQREQTVFRPQTITETRPETRSYYTPVLEYDLEPRICGRWNPFQQPTVAYQHVPRTHWERRDEVVQRTNTRTEWVAEKRKIDVPQRIVRMQRERKVDYEVVGRVAPQQSPTSSVASRLRPLDSNTATQSIYGAGQYAASTYSTPPLAASRSSSQSGMQVTELSAAAPLVPGQPLPPSTTAVGIADARTLPFFR